MKKVINSYRNITQLHSGFSSGTDWNVDIFSIADYTDIAFTSGSRLTFAKFLEPTLFSVEVPELRRPQECICLGQEKEIPGRFAHMSRLAFLCLYEHAVLAPASPPPHPREYHAISCANIQNFFLVSQHFRPHFCTCTESTCYICVLQVIHWGLSTSVLRDSQTSSRFSLPPSCLCLLWQTGWVTLPSPPAQQCTRFVSFTLGGVLAALLYEILDSICCHWK